MGLGAVTVDFHRHVGIVVGDWLREGEVGHVGMLPASVRIGLVSV